ncbi:unnamed protein product [Caenorhabditis sp. 36 PRJEB53466]|nr:unnamed protein product [Caenorhabditis sp. 36 PRJEB53466]
MQLHFLISVLVALVLIPSSQCTTCWVQNSIASVFTQACPSNIYQCMKFDCKITSPKKFTQTTKGCNDPANPPVSCTTLLTNCQAQGGTGQCYTCTGDYCNSSPASLSALLSVLIPTVTYFFFEFQIFRYICTIIKLFS